MLGEPRLLGMQQSQKTLKHPPAGCSQGLGAPSAALLGPNGVTVLVVTEPRLSQGLDGAAAPDFPG